MVNITVPGMYGQSVTPCMRKKSEAHKALLMWFKCDGFLMHMIVDSYKEQPLSGFKKKCQEADYHLTNTEPYSPWK